MWFDAATAVFIHGAIDLLLCLAAFYAWKVSVRLPCALYWSIGLFAFWMGHVAMFLYYMPELWEANRLGILLPAFGYIAHAAGLTALAKGSELLLGRPLKSWWTLPLVLAGLLGGGLFTIVLPSELSRIAIGNLVYTGFALRGFTAFFPKVPDAWNPGLTGRLAGLSFLGMAVLNAARAVSALIGLSGSLFFTSGLYNSIHAMMVVALFLTLSQLVYTRFHDELRLKIQENELLVRELHHRTKNNLALVASIVALEGGQLKDGAAKLAFESVEGRVLALSTLYERLQRGSGSAEIDLGEYIRDIASGVTSSIGRDDVAITCEDIIGGAVAPLSAAIPLGLVANELIINALKHAFPSGNGRISLRLCRSGDKLSLRVEDNGIGKKAPVGNAVTGQGLGSAIMDSLVRQLGGSLAFGRSEDGGTRAELLAPVQVSPGLNLNAPKSS